MSVVSNTPVEIWTEIINHVINDPIIFRIDPFYPGCNPHTAMRQWHDYTPIAQARNQRKLLRLVSKSWRILVDSRPQWFFENNTMDKAVLDPLRWESARRIHLCAMPNQCSCEEVCICTFHDYNIDLNGMFIERELPYHHVHEVLDGFKTTSPLPVQIMVVNSGVWQSMTDGKPVKRIGQLFSNLKALEISGFGDSITRIPTFIKNLTYLYMSLHPGSTDVVNNDPQVVFPSLTVLRLVLKDGPSFEYLQKWKLPKLLHLAILDLGYEEDSMDDVIVYLQRGWEIQTLSLIMEEQLVQFPAGLWTCLPRLQYLEINDLGESFNLPRSEHPLRTIAIFESYHYCMTRSRLTRLVKGTRIMVIADYHRWEDVTMISDEDLERIRTHERQIGENVCDGCIWETVSFCRKNGIRYEDRWARSLEEFRALCNTVEVHR